MSEKKNEEKKIIIDEDWKEEAKRTKEELKKEEEPAESEQTEEEQKRGPMPKADVPGLVSMFATQTLFALGVIAADETEKREPDLEIAKFNIDILTIIEEKTKGNLSDDEAKMLTDTLSQLRMVFVQISG